MNEVIAKRERITPKRAEQLLNQNTCNRGLRSGLVEKYAADMKAGRWTECAADIVIYENNEIADGQHRLYAIVESGAAQEFFVKYNFPKDAALNVDTGASRSYLDNKKIAHGELVSKPALSATDALVTKYAEWVAKAQRHVASIRILGRASVIAAIARAYMAGEPEDSLLRFAEVYSKGFANGEHESAAVSLRNAVMQHAARGINNALAERELFLKAQNAIQYFVKGKKLTILKVIEAEAYPLQKAKVRK
jgi:hypothetical protein